MTDTDIRPDEISDAAETEARIDVALVTDALLGTWAGIRREAREMIKDSAFWRIEGQPIPEHRERALTQLHLLVEAGASARAYPKEYGGLDNQGGNLAGFEELVVADPSLQIKSGVQWGLFGSAILQLGTKPHHDRWLRDAAEMRLPGAFAMTETGHGSDVQSLGDDRHLRRGGGGVRHRHPVPRRVEGVPRERGPAREGRDRVRPAHHRRRRLRRALLPGPDPRRLRCLPARRRGRGRRAEGRPERRRQRPPPLRPRARAAREPPQPVRGRGR